MRLWQVERDQSDGPIICRVREVANGYEVRLTNSRITQRRLRCRQLDAAVRLANRWLADLLQDGWRSGPLH